jgi:hypothetical protein
MIVELFSRGELSIPGVGVLWIKKIPAKRVPAQKKIYGPTLLVEFKEDTTIKSSELSGKLESMSHFSPDEAEKKVRETGTAILNNLLNFGESHLHRLGRFHRDDGGNFRFELDSQLQDTLRVIYPDLPLEPLPDENTRSNDVFLDHTFPHGPEYDKRTKTGWFFPFLALIATSLLLACLVSCFIQKRIESQLVPYLISGKQQSPAPRVVPADSFINDPATGNIFPEDTMEDTHDAAEPSKEDLRNDPAEPQTGQIETNMISPPPPEIHDEAQESMDSYSLTGIESMELDDILRISARKRLSFRKPCMIVVGSYMRRDLIDKMANRLISLEYEVYIEKYGSFYRTAIIYECDSVDTGNFLSKIRNTIEPKAWILQY